MAKWTGVGVYLPCTDVLICRGNGELGTCYVQVGKGLGTCHLVGCSTLVAI